MADNIMLPMREHTSLSPTTASKSLRWLAMTGLGADSGLKFPSALSGGMVKRAAFARALALGPEILFLDEPSFAFAIAAALFAVWLGSPGQRDDIQYRIHFPESVGGLAVGDTVKFRGVDAGTVKSIANDPDDPNLVQVDVRLRKETPVNTDTRASLALKTGGGQLSFDNFRCLG